jgi:uncharacterized membrane protein
MLATPQDQPGPTGEENPKERPVPELVPVFLTIHILTAIIAFGPTFAFPLIASMSAKEPQHGLFALHLTDRIEKRLTIPLALTMPISGGLLVWSEGLTFQDSHWLVLAVVLYLAAMTYAIVVQVRTLNRMIEIAQTMASASGAPAGAPAAAAGGTSVATPPALNPALAAGPGAALATAATMDAGRVAMAAELKRLGARVRNGGIFLVVMIFAIVSLMAGKPTL